MSLSDRTWKDGVMDIVEILKTNETLARLDLSNNNKLPQSFMPGLVKSLGTTLLLVEQYTVVFFFVMLMVTFFYFTRI